MTDTDTYLVQDSDWPWKCEDGDAMLIEAASPEEAAEKALDVCGADGGHFNICLVRMDCLAGAHRERDGTVVVDKAAIQSPSGREAIEARNAELEKDKQRLDFLDQLNRALNTHHKAHYGWRMVINENVNRLYCGNSLDVDLNDAGASVHSMPSCRKVIDEAMTRIEASRRIGVVDGSIEAPQNNHYKEAKDLTAQNKALREALVKIRGWREIGSADYPSEYLREIEGICDKALASTGEEG